ncbi:sigma-E factor negative regulatory protein RseA [Janthinobacterium lividum]|uniref:Sigma-E factor negative regulatory protein RseA n=2 Tax=Janthinobacterium lividum TaxID=29581 RepID=A0AB38C3P0_9BURK|nr:sigma-E factor negative regulatory protein RseA [Janthinobacterium lividum]
MAVSGFRTDPFEMAGPIMDTHTRLHETISALADGELAASELELAFAALDTDEGRQAWDAYRHIGDVLRSEQCGHALSKQFDARLAARLAAEAAPEGLAAHAEPLLPLSAAIVPPGTAEPLEAGPLAQR